MDKNKNISKCLKCFNHSVKDGRHYCNNRVAKTQKGLLCMCDIPCEKSIDTNYCEFVNRPPYRPITKEAKI